ncbi:DUF1697 domain-containing protein [Nocardioides dongxiaopingii]|uniref:DUF1697 domain-containing protein n=1 Tax=Nocardioides sp. S-1144 TaxID=2582905 RepID=UPI00110E0329|nr:DUF1697 domain-containing protein [Nocardioides sp. S-1144]QCW49909.1 DUF1697 domain-containing protein [Nocardioides sp. S-1144]
MPTYVAFLRAINLGATRKFPKEAIVAATGAAGFDDVATHINTGNVRLSTRMRSRTRVEDALERAYAADRGFEVPTIAYRTDELRAVVADADGFGHDAQHYVWLLKQEPSAALREQLEALSTADERVGVSERAVHLMVASGFLDARLLRPIEKAVGVATNRNVTVLRALVQKWC